MPNSYGYNPEKNIDGECMNDWQTGSSNVVLKTLIRYVFGFEPRIDGCWIQPAASCPLGAFEFKAPWRNRDVTIRYKDEQTGQRRFLVDGQEYRGQEDSVMGIQRLWMPLKQASDASLTVDVMD
jgi:cellobiose phosphorylase